MKNWIIRNFDRLLLVMVALVAPNFIAWTAGFDFDQRGGPAAILTIVTIWLSCMAWMISGVGRRS